MRKLSVSLIVVVIVSTFGLGWILNKIYDTRNPRIDRSAQVNQLNILKSLSESLNQVKNKDVFIDEWNEHANTTLNLFPRDDLPLPETLEDELNRGTPILLESSLGLEAHVLVDNGHQILSLTLPSAEPIQNTRHLELLLTLSFYGGIAAIILIWVWPLIHRLQNLRKVALAFGQGDLSARTKTGHTSYIRDIEIEFNRMADRIKSLIEDNKLLSRAVSHDLKTPLARLRFGLEALKDTENQALKEKYASRVDRDLEDMEDLIETLLQYARLDEAQVSLKLKKINTSTLLQGLIDKLDSPGIHIEFKKPHVDTFIQADARYISMLFNNILNNALKHAKEKILVRIETAPEGLLVSIEDDGPGIPAADRSEAIKPFWRAEASRDKKGHGMGLAIVARIAIWHKAQLEINQSPSLGGACIQLTIDTL